MVNPMSLTICLKKYWGEVSPGMKWKSGTPTIHMSVLLVGPALTHFNKAQFLEDCRGLSRFEDWRLGH